MGDRSAELRAKAAKSGTRTRGEIFERIGLVDKGNCAAVGVYATRWRGETKVEMHEMEMVHRAFSRAGTVIFVPLSRVDELIALLERARDFARDLPVPKVKRASSKQLKHKELTHED